MDKKPRFHCLFEQSGTFKREFIKLGYKAWDYDILNNYGETDYQVDLFAEIDGAYRGGQSVFDKVDENDIMLAFFPCVRFENQIMLAFRGQAHGMEKWDYKQKMIHDMKLLDELKTNYDLVNKLFIMCMDRGLRLIMENPYSEEHFLRRYWCYPPAIVDRDRRRNGDYFKKPTQFWFLNCEPQNNIIFEPIDHYGLDTRDLNRQMSRNDADIIGATTIKEARSMISPQYANRFIRQFILSDD